MPRIDLDRPVPARAVWLLGMCVLALIGVVAVRRHNETPVWIDHLPAERTWNWRRFASHGLVLGDGTAREVIVVFHDYDCPACASLSASLDTLLRQSPREYRVVFRYAFRAEHPGALMAARAAECASEQRQFARLHQRLYGDHAARGIEQWVTLAAMAGVKDTGAFRRCVVEDATVTQRIARDSIVGTQARISGVPTIFLRGLRVAGPRSVGELRRLLGEAPVGEGGF